jgi:hypothetical protein
MAYKTITYTNYDEDGEPFEDSYDIYIPDPVDTPAAEDTTTTTAKDTDSSNPNVYIGGSYTTPTDASGNPIDVTKGGVNSIENTKNTLASLPSDIAKGVLSKFTTDGVIDWVKLAGGALSAYGAYKGYQDAKTPPPPVGYQGGIPSYTAVQGRAPEPAAGARPGAGHQYFTGVQFANTKDQAALPAATAAIGTQLSGLAALNTANAQQDALKQAAKQAVPLTKMAYGGLTGLAHGGVPTKSHGTYLKGSTDGMADKIPGTIDGVQPARLAHGEFVIPADVVSHLGNGNSDAGAQQLHKMMDRIRTARTGNSKQGKEIDPSKFMPGGLASYAAGGGVARFVAGDTVPAGVTGTESNLSNFAGPYVTELMGKASALTSNALANPQFYQGQLTAGSSDLQNRAYEQAGNLGGQSFTNAGTAGTYMSPYMQNVVDIQKREAQRQSGIQGTQQQAQAVQAGAFGGGRDAIQRAERERNLGTQMNDIQAQGLQSAYQSAQNQYNTEQNKNLANISTMANLGNTQQTTEQAGLDAAQKQFEMQKADPYKQLQFQQSMLQGLPLAAQSYNTTTNPYAAAAAAGSGVKTVYDSVFGPSTTPAKP